MILLLSPSKTLSVDVQAPAGKYTVPEYLEEAAQLVALLRKRTRPQLQRLMNISQKLAGQVDLYLRSWQTPFNKKNSAPALLTFRGDVYEGLAAEDFNKHDRDFSQKHLRILSGLYGVLRPLDRMQPYRLEMGCPLSVAGRDKAAGFKNLYEFWGDSIRENLSKLVAAEKWPIVNLASSEYFKVLQPTKLELRIVTPTFKEKKGKNYKVLSFFAKKARGQMARFVIQKRLEEPEQMQSFREDGYRFNKRLSCDGELVFTRG
jgi:cytoplasmic iron level regulating protein YaaA (DUF328/UPF0246 family)